MSHDPICRFGQGTSRTTFPVKRAESSPVPPVRSTATELVVVGAGVIAIMVAMWWWPLLGLGAAAMATTFAFACWVGGER